MENSLSTGVDIVLIKRIEEEWVSNNFKLSEKKIDKIVSY